MPYAIIRHRVQDYDSWRSLFDEQSGLRRQFGSRGARVFRDADDPNQILVFFEWEDPDRGRELAQSDTTRHDMERAGVIDQPDMYFLEEVEPASA